MFAIKLPVGANVCHKLLQAGFVYQQLLQFANTWHNLPMVGKLQLFIPSVGVPYHDWHHTKIRFAGKIEKRILVCHQ
jgi:hypothetical protein